MLAFSDLIDSTGDLIKSWRHFLLTHLLAVAISSLLVFPALVALLGVFLLAAEDRVLSDEDILIFLLHPVGWCALLVVGSLYIGVLIAQLGTMLVIAYGAVGGYRYRCTDALWFVLFHRHSLWRLAGHALVIMPRNWRPEWLTK